MNILTINLLASSLVFWVTANLPLPGTQATIWLTPCGDLHCAARDRQPQVAPQLVQAAGDRIVETQRRRAVQ